MNIALLAIGLGSIFCLGVRLIEVTEEKRWLEYQLKQIENREMLTAKERLEQMWRRGDG